MELSAFVIESIEQMHLLWTVWYQLTEHHVMWQEFLSMSTYWAKCADSYWLNLVRNVPKCCVFAGYCRSMKRCIYENSIWNGVSGFEARVWFLMQGSDIFVVNKALIPSSVLCFLKKANFSFPCSCHYFTRKGVFFLRNLRTNTEHEVLGKSPITKRLKTQYLLLPGNTEYALLVGKIKKKVRFRFLLQKWQNPTT